MISSKGKILQTIPDSKQNFLPEISLLESRVLTLDYPQSIRVGESDKIQLVFDVDRLGLLPTVISTGSQQPKSETNELQDLFDEYNVMAEARLEMPGMDIRPREMISETLLQGQKVTFYWSLLPEKAGQFTGTVWFYLRYIPKVKGEEIRIALFAQPLQIDALSFFGLKINALRLLSLLGLLISFLIGYPYLFSKVK
jgi:hypothetical protein